MSLSPSTLLHAPNGDWSKAHPDSYMAYRSWDGSNWFAKIVGNTFVHAPNGDWARSHEDTIINYLSWDGSKWQATVSNGTFRHSPGGDVSKSHLDTILTYLCTDGSHWTMKLAQPPAQSLPPFATTAYDGTGPNPTSDCVDGALLRSVTVYWSDSYFKCIEFTLTNGAAFSHGNKHADNDVRSFTFEPGELVTRVEIGRGHDRVDFLYFETNTGKTFEAGPGGRTDQNLLPHPAFLGGFFTCSGSDVDCLAVIYTHPTPASYRISNVVFDTARATVTQLQPVVDFTLELTNNTDFDQPGVSATREYSVTTTRSWSDTVGLTFGVEASITFPLPELDGGEVGVKASAEMQTSHTWGQEQSETKTTSYTATAAVPAHRTVRCRVTAQTWQMELPYEADLVVQYTNGEHGSYKLKGVYRGLQVDAVQQSYTG